MDVRVGLWRKLGTEELMLLNCGAGEDSWTARRPNQFILKEISPGCSSEGLMLRLKLQYFGHLMWRVDSLEKTLMLGGTGGRRRRGTAEGWDGLMASPTQWTWVWINSGSWWWTGRPGVLQFMGSQRVGHDWVTELNWTELKEFWYQRKQCLVKNIFIFFLLIILWLILFENACIYFLFEYAVNIKCLSSFRKLHRSSQIVQNTLEKNYDFYGFEYYSLHQLL